MLAELIDMTDVAEVREMTPSTPARIAVLPPSRHGVIAAFCVECRTWAESLAALARSVACGFAREAKYRGAKLDSGVVVEIRDVRQRAREHLLFLLVENGNLRYRVADLCKLTGETPFEVDDALDHPGEYVLVHVDEYQRLQQSDSLAQAAANARGGE